MDEGWFSMIVHSAIITIVLYVIMLYGFRQTSDRAIHRSVLIGAIALVYMLMFGHGLPTRLHPNL